MLYPFFVGGIFVGYYSEIDYEQGLVGTTSPDQTGEPIAKDKAYSVNRGGAGEGRAPELPQCEPESAGEPISANAQKTEAEEEDAKRRSHEEAEAKRKAEWEAKQRAKKDAERVQLEHIASMSDQEVMTTSMQRIGADTERLTRRNMKECVSEYIQTLCLSDPAFARRAMHPRKSMIHCIWYINRKAQEYVEKEMKDNGIKPDRNGIYGSDVPDDLCYQWAEEYYNDPNAKEDQEEEEKFVPRPYVEKTKSAAKSGARSKSKKAEEKKSAQVKASTERPVDSDQITLGDFGGMEEHA